MSEENNRSFEDIAAQKKAEDELEKTNLLQRPTVLVLIFALVLILLLAVVLPTWESITLNSWIAKAGAEARAVYPNLPEVPFAAMDYSSEDHSMVFYDYAVIDPDPIPQRVEVGRSALPADAALGTFKDARSLGDGALFARRIKFNSTDNLWEGLYITEGELGALEDYLIRDAGDGLYYLSHVPESAE